MLVSLWTPFSLLLFHLGEMGIIKRGNSLIFWNTFRQFQIILKSNLLAQKTFKHDCVYFHTFFTCLLVTLGTPGELANFHLFYFFYIEMSCFGLLWALSPADFFFIFKVNLMILFSFLMLNQKHLASSFLNWIYPFVVFFFTFGGKFYRNISN